MEDVLVESDQQVEADLVRVENLRVQYGRLIALNDVTMSIRHNEVVGLLGNNGAGKSTLANFVSGNLPNSGGRMYLDGKAVRLSSVAEAREEGISTAYQDAALVDSLSVLRNFFLGNEIVRGRGIFSRMDYGAMSRVVSEILEEIGVTKRYVHERADTLSGGERRSVAIRRAAYFGTRLLILDEPLAGLSESEVDGVLQLVRSVKQRGGSVLFITHNAHEVFDVADRFVILANGKNYAEIEKDDTDYRHLEKLMISTRLSAVREMTSSVAHQIGNPLGVMRISAETLRDEFEVTERADQYAQIVRMIIDEVNKLDTVVRSFLDFARPANLDFRLWAADDVVRKAMADLPLHNHPGVEVVVEVADPAPVFLMDGQLMAHALSNLISNAIEASPCPGKVVVRARSELERLHFEVEDWGAGIDGRLLKRVFAPFVTSKPKGTGLGLPVAKKIVDQHDGTITASPKAAGGTVFKIIL